LSSLISQRKAYNHIPSPTIFFSVFTSQSQKPNNLINNLPIKLKMQFIKLLSLAFAALAMANPVPNAEPEPVPAREVRVTDKLSFKKEY
jgi:hypothetical protein